MTHTTMIPTRFRRRLPAVTRGAMAGLWVLAAAATPLSAQRGSSPAPRQAFDRSVIPTAGASPQFHMPTWSNVTLANGAQLLVTERHTLPLVSISITFIGGGNQFEPADKKGLGNFVASMLTEGTTTKTGDELSTAFQLLGTSASVAVGGESGTVSLVSMRDKFGPALDLLADELLHPAFPADALERLRQRTLVSLTQNKDRTAGIANILFPRLLYTTDHPYGRTLSEQSAKAVTRQDLVDFHRAYFQPGRAVITVVGDITPAVARQQIERAFREWTSGGSRPAFSYPALPAAKPTTIYLADKPGAAQSTVAIGLPGPPRSTPDYAAVRVMNQILGELFLSRLNANIREQKGYSYGVASRFAFGRGPGAFRAGGDIRTSATDSALVEFVKEFRGIRGGRPVTDDELASGKAALIQSLPGELESVTGVGGLIGTIYAEGLPDDYYQQFIRDVERVTAADVERVAKTYIDPDHLVILVVGDRKVIEERLRATGIGPVVIVEP